MNFKIIFTLGLVLLVSSCLKTRADLGEQNQSQVYGKKNADNQNGSPGPKSSQLATKAQVAIDDRDDLIRGFNGRIEGLENQISILQKEKEANSEHVAQVQKMQLLQDELVKMEAQIQKLEAEVASTKVAVAPAPMVSSDVNASKSAGTKKGAAASPAYETAQEHFGKKEWKKAILSYQKYVDENSKGKNIPDAKYKIGVCFQELGMKDEATAFYEEVIANYGKSESGKKAKIRLAKIKK